MWVRDFLWNQKASSKLIGVSHNDKIDQWFGNRTKTRYWKHTYFKSATSASTHSPTWCAGEPKQREGRSLGGVAEASTEARCQVSSKDSQWSSKCSQITLENKILSVLGR